jgi:two-component system, cell cycle response regulator DivK
MPSSDERELVAQVEALRKSLLEERAKSTRLAATLAEALEQQTAAAEILRVISSSPTDTQPVFDAIARNAVRLCGAMFGAVFSFDGTLMHFVAGYGFTARVRQLLTGEYPIPPRGLNREAITDRAVVHVVDMLSDPRVANVEVARRLGSRSQLAVPMLQSGTAIGTINVYGAEPRPFSDAQIALLQTFADQAVIAIENVRLLSELQAKNADLTEALSETQGLMAKILLVEDNEMNRDMLSRRLGRRGYDVAIAVDGEQGVAMARSEAPALILMDMSLPGLDGWEATRQIKATPETRGIPVIALTAHAMSGDREKAIAAGCDDFDTKPVDLARLIEKIEALLGRAAGA